MHRLEPFAPAQYARLLQLLAPLHQDIQVAPARVLVDALALRYSDHKSGESPQ